MAVTKTTYGTVTAVPGLTLNSVASAGTATSTAVNNTTDLALDALVSVTVTTASGTLGSNPTVDIYALGSLDNTTYADVGNAAYLGSVVVTTAATAATKDNMSVAEAFGGSMPPYWKIYVVNNTGLGLGSSGNSANYVELTLTTA